MTDSYLTLTTFVPGTKAKADEVNANFSALKEAINSKAPINGDASKVFSVSAATADTHAVNKSQMDTLSEDLMVEIVKSGAKFCVKSGNTTSGQGDLFSYSVLTISPKIGGVYPSLVFLDYKGTKSIISSTPASINMAGKTDGTYNIFIKPDGTLYTQINKIYKQADRPTLVDGDVWLNTSKIPFSCIKYTNSADVEFVDVPLGSVKIESSAITSLKTFTFNQNGFDVNVASFTQNFATNGWLKLPNDLIMQWGYYAGGANSPTITFPIAFPGAVLNISSTIKDPANSFVTITTASLTSFCGLQTAQGGTNTIKPFYWLAIGY